VDESERKDTAPGIADFAIPGAVFCGKTWLKPRISAVKMGKHDIPCGKSHRYVVKYMIRIYVDRVFYLGRITAAPGACE
jgi:hypothetical protein